VSDLRDCEPVLATVRRGWMARTPDSHTHRIAVIAQTPEAAKEAFAIELTRWQELHDLAGKARLDADTVNERP
jgi:hypothetical protein